MSVYQVLLLLLVAFALAEAQCPTNTIYINSQCVPVSCSPPSILQNGVCVNPNGTQCGNGQVYVNGGCSNIIINVYPASGGGQSSIGWVPPNGPGQIPCPNQPLTPYPPLLTQPTPSPTPYPPGANPAQPNPCPNSPVTPFPPTQPLQPPPVTADPPVQQNPCGNTPVTPFPPTNPLQPPSYPSNPETPYPPVQQNPNNPVTQNPQSPCANSPVTPFPPYQPIQPPSYPLNPATPYPPGQQNPCPNSPVTPFPPTSPVQPNPCPNSPITPFPPTSPVQPNPCPNSPVTPFPPTSPVQPNPCPNSPVTPFPPTSPVEPNPCPNSPVSPYPPTPPVQTNPCPNNTLTPPIDPVQPTQTPPVEPITPIDTPELTTTEPKEPSVPATTPPPAPLIHCPEGTILLNGKCRLVYCSSGIYSDGRCVRTRCPSGTTWTGQKCEKPKPIELGPIHLEKTIINPKADAGANLVIHNVNNLLVNASIALTPGAAIDSDEYEEEEDEEEVSPSPAPDATKCCNVVSPRLCRGQAENIKWKCFSRTQQQCGDFCSASKVVLKPSNVTSWYDGNDEMLIMPPNWQSSCQTTGKCDQSKDHHDCSGCAAGLVATCSSYCYTYRCSSHNCAFYDQEQYCQQYAGKVGCRPEDGWFQ